MARMCSSTKAVPKSASLAKFSTTVNSIVVTTSPMLPHNVMLPFDLSRSFDVDKSYGSPSLNIKDSQSVVRKSFEIRFGWSPVSRRHNIGFIILFPAPIEVRTKYAKSSVTTRTEVFLCI